MSAFNHLFQKINEVRDQYNAPAIMAAIVRHGGDYTVAALTGVRKADLPGNNNNVIQGDDKFCLGSCSKPVSGYLIASFVQQGSFSWNKRIKDVFPEFQNSSCRKHYNIRDNYLNADVAQMMTHTAYFPWAPSNSMDYMLEVNGYKPDINSSFQTEYCNNEALKQRRYNYIVTAQQDAPMTQYQYNGGPIIPSAMLERLFNKSYEELLNEHVFVPLGMTSAGVGRLATSSSPNGTWQHSFDAGTNKFIPDELTTKKIFNYNAHAPAGAVHFTYTDAIKFLTALFPNNGKAKAVIKKQMLDSMLPVYANGFALSGWLSNGSGNNLYISHDGDNGLSYCRMSAWPNKGNAYIVCSNCGGSKGGTVVDAVAQEIHNMMNNWTNLFPGE
jgi:CubicO group peptidase (beta-lactamase class C family)